MNNEQTIYLGGGCFWCIEAVFQVVPGVIGVCSGYAGGDIAHPTYDQICTGTTGHAEIVRVIFDTEKVPLTKILDIFFESHDPTSLNRQGGDVGTQYRSVIFTTNDEQADSVESYIDSRSLDYSQPIVTQVLPLDIFYEAEISHQNYFRSHPEKAYCQIVIAPKVEKAQKVIKG